MASSFIFTITPQAGTVPGGESPSPPPPPPPPPDTAVPRGSLPDVLIYNDQVLFEGSPTQAAVPAGFRLLSASDHPVPLVLILDNSMQKALAQYFKIPDAGLGLNYPDAGLGYISPDNVLVAAKEFKKRQREEADAHPKFAKFFDNIERVCMEVQKTYLANSDAYEIYDFDFGQSYSHQRRFWRTFLALVLHQEAIILVADGGLITATGKPQKSVLQNIGISFRTVTLQFSIADQKMRPMKELKWSELPNLSAVGITFEEQKKCTDSHKISKADTQTQARDVVEKNRIEGLEKGVQELRDRLKGLETGVHENHLSDGYEDVEPSDIVG